MMSEQYPQLIPELTAEDAPSEDDVSVVVLNYKRPDNVHEIYESLRKQLGLDHRRLVIANNQPHDERARRWSMDPRGLSMATVVDLGGRNHCGAARHAVAQAVVPTAWTIFVDDDLLPGPTFVADFVRAIREHRIVHGMSSQYGLHGRYFGDHATYGARKMRNAPYPDARPDMCCRLSAVRTAELWAAAMYETRVMRSEPGIPLAKLRRNADDMCLSLGLTAATGLRPAQIRRDLLDVTELPAPSAVHEDADHRRVRTRVLKHWRDRR